MPRKAKLLLSVTFSLLPSFLAAEGAEPVQINPSICAAGYDKEISSTALAVPNEGLGTVMLSVILDKFCEGPVIIEIDSEVYSSGSAIRVGPRMTCLAGNGYTNACLSGSIVAPPGTAVYLAENDTDGYESRSFKWVLDNQKPGRWKYDVVLAADFSPSGLGYVGDRILTVEAHPKRTP